MGLLVFDFLKKVDVVKYHYEVLRKYFRDLSLFDSPQKSRCVEVVFWSKLKTVRNQTRQNMPKKPLVDCRIRSSSRLYW